jgi:hypothetical protein
VDLCDNTLKACSYQTLAVDVDQDQHYPLSCGGTADDCDDNDAFTFPGALERCDFKDNNCNGAVDEGLWTEEAGARGAISASAAYPPRAGPPAVHQTATEVLVFAAADTTTGTLDAWRLSSTDLSVVATAVPLEASTTSWSSCLWTNPVTATYTGKRVGRPQVAANGDSLLITANVASYTNPQATCCNMDGAVSRATATQVTPSTMSTPVHTTLATRTDAPGTFNGACFGGTAELTGVAITYDRAAAAWSAHLNRWVTTWWSKDPGPDLSLRFNTITTAGAIAAERPVYDVAGALPQYDPQTAYQYASPRVAVGNNTVLFVWTNKSNQPYASRYLRWVLYDANLTSVVAGPFEFGQFPNVAQTAIVGLAAPKIDKATFDGTNYVLTLNPTENFTTGVVADARVRFLTVNEQGVLIANKPTTGAPTGADPSGGAGFVAGVQPALAAMAQGRGMVTAMANGTSIRFTWSSTSADAGYQSSDIALGVARTAHTDAVLVPLSDTRVGLIWSDGNLQRTIMRCGP